MVPTQSQRTAPISPKFEKYTRGEKTRDRLLLPEFTTRGMKLRREKVEEWQNNSEEGEMWREGVEETWREKM